MSANYSWGTPVFFETHAIPYHIVGSLASMAFGEPRFTNDIDIAAELTTNHVPDLCRAFPAPDYYLSEPAARDAILIPKLRSALDTLNPNLHERFQVRTISGAMHLKEKGWVATINFTVVGGGVFVE